MVVDSWRGVQGVDRDHDTAYQATLLAYEMVRGEPPDQHWRAQLYVSAGDCKGQQHVAHGSERLLCADHARDSGRCIGIDRLTTEPSVARLCIMLLPLTVSAGDRDLWAWMMLRLDFNQGHAHLEDTLEPSCEAQQVLTLARHLFRGSPTQVNIASLLQSLGDRSRAVLLGSMNEFCG